ncbi:MAG: hypothetical protein Q4F49_01140 [Pseudoxanthomonas suwonensis]|nr:hypothetical protein [Pseudoxanthomonas suwonensis]
MKNAIDEPAARTTRGMILLLPALLALGACTTTPPVNGGGEGEILQLRGAATKVVNDCYFDAVCTVTVDGVEVTTMSGMRSQPPPVWGTSTGQPEVGQQVEVRCLRTGPSSCTLLGSRDYYLRASR